MTTNADLTISDVDLADDAALTRWLAVRNPLDPRPLTLAGFRAELTAATAHLELLATLDGVDVGASTCGWGAIFAESRTAFLEVWVTPSARRRGIGTMLVERCIAFARGHGMETGRSMARDGDGDALRFAGRFGLRAVGRGQVGYLDLVEDHATRIQSKPSGLTISAHADRPDLERAVYDLDILVLPEIPTLADEPVPSFEAWQAQTSGDPGFMPELSLLAEVDGRVVGAIQVYDNGEGTAFIGMTAVHPEVRRRGIARALKNELATRAARAGWHRIETFNDGTNERMRALNADLGYVYLPRMVSLKGPLPNG